MKELITKLNKKNWIDIVSRDWLGIVSIDRSSTSDYKSKKKNLDPSASNFDWGYSIEPR